LVREDGECATSGVPVVRPGAAPGGYVGPGSRLKAYKPEAAPKTGSPAAFGLETTTSMGERFGRRKVQKPTRTKRTGSFAGGPLLRDRPHTHTHTHTHTKACWYARASRREAQAGEPASSSDGHGEGRALPPQPALEAGLWVVLDFPPGEKAGGEAFGWH
jgi:hypothetical protein